MFRWSKHKKTEQEEEKEEKSQSSDESKQSTQQQQQHREHGEDDDDADILEAFGVSSPSKEEETSNEDHAEEKDDDADILEAFGLSSPPRNESPDEQQSSSENNEVDDDADILEAFGLSSPTKEEDEETSKEDRTKEKDEGDDDDADILEAFGLSSPPRKEIPDDQQSSSEKEVDNDADILEAFGLSSPSKDEEETSKEDHAEEKDDDDDDDDDADILEAFGLSSPPRNESPDEEESSSGKEVDDDADILEAFGVSSPSKDEEETSKEDHAEEEDDDADILEAFGLSSPPRKESPDEQESSSENNEADDDADILEAFGLSSPSKEEEESTEDHAEDHAKEEDDDDDADILEAFGLSSPPRNESPDEQESSSENNEVDDDAREQVADESTNLSSAAIGNQAGEEDNQDMLSQSQRSVESQERRGSSFFQLFSPPSVRRRASLAMLEEEKRQKFQMVKDFVGEDLATPPARWGSLIVDDPSMEAMAKLTLPEIPSSDDDSDEVEISSASSASEQSLPNRDTGDELSHDSSSAAQVGVPEDEKQHSNMDSSQRSSIFGSLQNMFQGDRDETRDRSSHDSDGDEHEPEGEGIDTKPQAGSVVSEEVQEHEEHAPPMHENAKQENDIDTSQRSSIFGSIRSLFQDESESNPHLTNETGTSPEDHEPILEEDDAISQSSPKNPAETTDDLENKTLDEIITSPEPQKSLLGFLGLSSPQRESLIQSVAQDDMIAQRDSEDVAHEELDGQEKMKNPETLEEGKRSSLFGLRFPTPNPTDEASKDEKRGSIQLTAANDTDAVSPGEEPRQQSAFHTNEKEATDQQKGPLFGLFGPGPKKAESDTKETGNNTAAIPGEEEPKQDSASLTTEEGTATQQKGPPLFGLFGSGPKKEESMPNKAAHVTATIPDEEPKQESASLTTEEQVTAQQKGPPLFGLFGPGPKKEESRPKETEINTAPIPDEEPKQESASLTTEEQVTAQQKGPPLFGLFGSGPKKEESRPKETANNTASIPDEEPKQESPSLTTEEQVTEQQKGPPLFGLFGSGPKKEESRPKEIDPLELEKQKQEEIMKLLWGEEQFKEQQRAQQNLIQASNFQDSDQPAETAIEEEPAPAAEDAASRLQEPQRGQGSNIFESFGSLFHQQSFEEDDDAVSPINDTGGGTSEVSQENKVAQTASDPSEEAQNVSKNSRLGVFGSIFNPNKDDALLGETQLQVDDDAKTEEGIEEVSMQIPKSEGEENEMKSSLEIEKERQQKLLMDLLRLDENDMMEEQSKQAVLISQSLSEKQGREETNVPNIEMSEDIGEDDAEKKDVAVAGAERVEEAHGESTTSDPNDGKVDGNSQRGRRFGGFGSIFNPKRDETPIPELERSEDDEINDTGGGTSEVSQENKVAQTASDPSEEAQNVSKNPRLGVFGSIFNPNKDDALLGETQLEGDDDAKNEEGIEEVSMKIPKSEGEENEMKSSLEIEKERQQKLLMDLLRLDENDMMEEQSKQAVLISQSLSEKQGREETNVPNIEMSEDIGEDDAEKKDAAAAGAERVEEAQGKPTTSDPNDGKVDGNSQRGRRFGGFGSIFNPKRDETPIPELELSEDDEICDPDIQNENIIAETERLNLAVEQSGDSGSTAMSPGFGGFGSFFVQNKSQELAPATPELEQVDAKSEDNEIVDSNDIADPKEENTSASGSGETVESATSNRRKTFGGIGSFFNANRDEALMEEAQSEYETTGSSSDLGVPNETEVSKYSPEPVVEENEPKSALDIEKERQQRLLMELLRLDESAMKDQQEQQSVLISQSLSENQGKGEDKIGLEEDPVPSAEKSSLQGTRPTHEPLQGPGSRLNQETMAQRSSEEEDEWESSLEPQSSDEPEDTVPIVGPSEDQIDSSQMQSKRLSSLAIEKQEKSKLMIEQLGIDEEQMIKAQRAQEDLVRKSLHGDTYSMAEQIDPIVDGIGSATSVDEDDDLSRLEVFKQTEAATPSPQLAQNTESPSRGFAGRPAPGAGRVSLIQTVSSRFRQSGRVENHNARLQLEKERQQRLLLEQLNLDANDLQRGQNEQEELIRKCVSNRQEDIEQQAGEVSDGTNEIEKEAAVEESDEGQKAKETTDSLEDSKEEVDSHVLLWWRQKLRDKNDKTTGVPSEASIKSEIVSDLGSTLESLASPEDVEVDANTESELVPKPIDPISRELPLADVAPTAVATANPSNDGTPTKSNISPCTSTQDKETIEDYGKDPNASLDDQDKAIESEPDMPPQSFDVMQGENHGALDGGLGDLQGELKPSLKAGAIIREISARHEDPNLSSSASLHAQTSAEVSPLPIEREASSNTTSDEGKITFESTETEDEFDPTRDSVIVDNQSIQPAFSDAVAENLDDDQEEHILESSLEVAIASMENAKETVVFPSGATTETKDSKNQDIQTDALDSASIPFTDKENSAVQSQLTGASGTGRRSESANSDEQSAHVHATVDTHKAPGPDPETAQEALSPAPADKEDTLINQADGAVELADGALASTTIRGSLDPNLNRIDVSVEAGVTCDREVAADISKLPIDMTQMESVNSELAYSGFGTPTILPNDFLRLAEHDGEQDAMGDMGKHSSFPPSKSMDLKSAREGFGTPTILPNEFLRLPEHGGEKGKHSSSTPVERADLTRGQKGFGTLTVLPDHFLRLPEYHEEEHTEKRTIQEIGEESITGKEVLVSETSDSIEAVGKDSPDSSGPISQTDASIRDAGDQAADENPVASAPASQVDDCTRAVEEDTPNADTVTTVRASDSSPATTVRVSQVDDRIRAVEEDTSNADPAMTVRVSQADDSIKVAEEYAPDASPATTVRVSQVEDRIRAVEEDTSNADPATTVRVSQADDSIKVAEEYAPDASPATTVRVSQADDRIRAVEEDTSNADPAKTVRVTQADDSINVAEEYAPDASPATTVRVSQAEDRIRAVEEYAPSTNPATRLRVSQADDNIKVAEEYAPDARPATTVQVSQADDNIKVAEEDATDANPANPPRVSRVDDRSSPVEEDTSNAHPATAVRASQADDDIKVVEEDAPEASSATTVPVYHTVDNIEVAEQDAPDANPATAAQVAQAGDQISIIQENASNADPATAVRASQADCSIKVAEEDAPYADEASKVQVAQASGPTSIVEEEACNVDPATTVQVSHVDNRITVSKEDTSETHPTTTASGSQVSDSTRKVEEDAGNVNPATTVPVSQTDDSISIFDKEASDVFSPSTIPGSQPDVSVRVAENKADSNPPGVSIKIAEEDATDASSATAIHSVSPDEQEAPDALPSSTGASIQRRELDSDQIDNLSGESIEVPPSGFGQDRAELEVATSTNEKRAIVGGDGLKPEVGSFLVQSELAIDGGCRPREGEPPFASEVSTTDSARKEIFEARSARSAGLNNQGETSVALLESSQKDQSHVPSTHTEHTDRKSLVDTTVKENIQASSVCRITQGEQREHTQYIDNANDTTEDSDPNNGPERVPVVQLQLRHNHLLVTIDGNRVGGTFDVSRIQGVQTRERLFADIQRALPGVVISGSPGNQIRIRLDLAGTAVDFKVEENKISLVADPLKFPAEDVPWDQIEDEDQITYLTPARTIEADDHLDKIKKENDSSHLSQKSAKQALSQDHVDINVTEKAKSVKVDSNLIPDDKATKIEESDQKEDPPKEQSIPFDERDSFRADRRFAPFDERGSFIAKSITVPFDEMGSSHGEQPKVTEAVVVESGESQMDELFEDEDNSSKDGKENSMPLSDPTLSASWKESTSLDRTEERKLVASQKRCSQSDDLPNLPVVPHMHVGYIDEDTIPEEDNTAGETAVMEGSLNELRTDVEATTPLFPVQEEEVSARGEARARVSAVDVKRNELPNKGRMPATAHIRGGLTREHEQIRSSLLLRKKVDPEGKDRAIGLTETLVAASDVYSNRPRNESNYLARYIAARKKAAARAKSNIEATLGGPITKTKRDPSERKAKDQRRAPKSRTVDKRVFLLPENSGAMEPEGIRISKKIKPRTTTAGVVESQRLFNNLLSLEDENKTNTSALETYPSDVRAIIDGAPVKSRRKKKERGVPDAGIHHDTKDKSKMRKHKGDRNRRERNRSDGVLTFPPPSDTFGVPPRSARSQLEPYVWNQKEWNGWQQQQLGLGFGTGRPHRAAPGLFFYEDSANDKYYYPPPSRSRHTPPYSNNLSEQQQSYDGLARGANHRKLPSKQQKHSKPSSSRRKEEIIDLPVTSSDRKFQRKRIKAKMQRLKTTISKMEGNPNMNL